MRAKAKSSNTPCPLWIEGEYITLPPIRPVDGAKRPEGHYIDKGGYPGANVYEVDPSTLCRQTATVDRHEKPIYEKDFLIYETEEEIGYFLVTDTETAVDIVNGEIFGIEELRQEDIKIIGSMEDYPDFLESIQYHVENGLDVPYLPALDVMETPLPFFEMTCLKCGYVTLNCRYTAKHKDCGGYFRVNFATKVYRKGEKEKALA